MRYVKALSACAAMTASLAATISIGTPALAKAPPIVVPAPAPDEVVSRHISFADLNLAATAGQRVLIRRVNYAVNDMCVQMAGGLDGSFMSNTAQARCTQASWDQARPQLDAAFQRAREIASTGKSSIAATALTITVPAER
jgi:UrcA family protein